MVALLRAGHNHERVHLPTGSSALHLAVAINHMPLADLLLQQHGVRIDAADKVGLQTCSGDQRGLFSPCLLFSHHFSGWPSFHLAPAAHLLPFQQNGNTSLHLAALQSSQPMISLLLENGAVPDTVNGDGETPLVLAARNADASSVATLADACLPVRKKKCPWLVC